MKSDILRLFLRWWFSRKPCRLSQSNNLSLNSAKNRIWRACLTSRHLLRLAATVQIITVDNFFSGMSAHTAEALSPAVRWPGRNSGQSPFLLARSMRGAIPHALVFLIKHEQLKFFFYCIASRLGAGGRARRFIADRVFGATLVMFSWR